MTIDRYGIEFRYRCDLVIWLWWWQRRNGYKYVSILSEGGFNSLAEIDQFWRDYAAACALSGPLR